MLSYCPGRNLLLDHFPVLLNYSPVWNRHIRKFLSEFMTPLLIVAARAHTHTHTHTHIYIYIYMCVYVCLCVCVRKNTCCCNEIRITNADDVCRTCSFCNNRLWTNRELNKAYNRTTLQKVTSHYGHKIMTNAFTLTIFNHKSFPVIQNTSILITFLQGSCSAPWTIFCFGFGIL